MQSQRLWKRYRKYLCRVGPSGLTLDISRMPFEPAYLAQMQPRIEHAYAAMDRLEAGEIANPDENRMVGHYWLRNPERAPTQEIRQAIEQTVQDIRQFAAAVHKREIKPPRSPRFTDVLSIGIGGSALGPQLVADALGAKRDKLRLSFLDNTDSDGIERTLESISTRLKSTLVLVISKSGSTPEPRNAMLETQRAFVDRQLDFAAQAVAITGEGSQLDQQAQREGWLKRFPMWDWVGGRTSVMGPVGLVPLALQGVDIAGLLKGAREMDHATRSTQTRRNPAALLALMWHLATNGRGEKDMVILPYKDRLLLLSRYLQQLIMESLGKELDLEGNIVEQGIAVYGNKGSTDQHAFVQQLRDGVNNFFATFVVVLQDSTRSRSTVPVDVDPQRPGGVTSGDYLNGFWQGTRQALYEKGRGSITITLDKLDARSLGAMIALYERTVGFYATLVNINAYHQPGVEAGKKAAASVLDLQAKVVEYFQANPEASVGAEGVAEQIGEPDRVESVHHILEHLAANKRIVSRTRKTYQAL